MSVTLVVVFLLCCCCRGGGYSTGTTLCGGNRTRMVQIDFDELHVVPPAPTPDHPGTGLPTIELPRRYLRGDYVFRRMNSRMTGWPCDQLPVLNLATAGEQFGTSKFSVTQLTTSGPNCLVTVGEHLWLTVNAEGHRLVYFEMAATELANQHMFIALYTKGQYRQTLTVTLCNRGFFVPVLIRPYRAMAIDEVIIGCVTPLVGHCGMVTYDTFLFDTTGIYNNYFLCARGDNVEHHHPEGVFGIEWLFVTLQFVYTTERTNGTLYRV
jgi:hypothetical protein